MPFHVPALAAAAAGYVTAHDCLRADDISLTNEEAAADGIFEMPDGFDDNIHNNVGDDRLRDLDENDVDLNTYSPGDTPAGSSGRHQAINPSSNVDANNDGNGNADGKPKVLPDAFIFASNRAETRRSVRFFKGADNPTSPPPGGRKRLRPDSINPRVDAAIDESVRSMRYSEHASVRSTTGQRQQPMIVQLKAESSSFDHAMTQSERLSAPGMVYQDSSLLGFTNGDFGSGKVKNIRLTDECWVIAYNGSSSVLAVGLQDRIDFLETKNYTCMHSIPFTGTVSAIQWCDASVLDGAKPISPEVPSTNWKDSKRSLYDINNGELIAVAGLDGKVALYHVYIPLLELRGATQLHSFHVKGSIRSLAMQYVSKYNCLVLAIGDTTGKVTISTLMKDSETGFLQEVNQIVEDRGRNNAVLGLAIHGGSDEHNEFVAVTCRDGSVKVFALFNHVPSVMIDGLSIRNHALGFIAMGEEMWSTQRNGPTRAVVVFQDASRLIFGGYDKTLVVVDMKLWAVVREIPLQGTINHISFDRLGRYMVLGCRDKSITLFDTSTFAPIKRWETSGWVTCVSWANPGIFSDLMAVRSENKGLSLIDLTPIHAPDVRLSHEEGSDGCDVTWSPDGHYLARIDGERIAVVDARFGFVTVASCGVVDSSEIKQIEFSPVLLNQDSDDDDKKDALMMVAVGLNGYVQLLELRSEHNKVSFEIVQALFIEPNLWTVRWSNDGKWIYVGGKGGNLHVLSSNKLKRNGDPIAINDRIWGVECIKMPPVDGDAARDSSVRSSPQNASNTTSTAPMLAVASGDYKAILFDGGSLQPVLQVMRPRAVRCLASHPTQPLLAVGDGAGMVAIVDYQMEETVLEFEVADRVNSLDFSPVGDYLLVGTDGCAFILYETKMYNPVQKFERDGFAVVGRFSSNGKYIALGTSNDYYSIIRLGPFLGIDHVPLSDKDVLSQLPPWALKETIHRSGYGPSLIQRQMMIGSHESLQWVARTLKDHPDAIYTFDRMQEEGCFDTAIRLRKIKLLKLALTTMVDGSMELNMDGRRSILTSEIPEIGMAALKNMLINHPSDLAVSVLREMTFVKVPFAKPRMISKEAKRIIRGSESYLDPWMTNNLFEDVKDEDSESDYNKLIRTPAVLPLPGLGSFDFLSILTLKAPATAFDNEAMGLVLKVLWKHHIRRYFIVDTMVFTLYYALWMVLVDVTTSSTNYLSSSRDQQAVASFLIVVNSIFVVKECLQSNFGRRPGYFSSLWNIVDILSCILVYSYTFMVVTETDFDDGTIPVAVVTTLLLTMKLLSYLRAFHETGWLVAVLNQNFRDVRGFLVVLLAIIIGFSTAFRLVFGEYEPKCDLQIDKSSSTAAMASSGAQADGLVTDCDANPFGSLRRSFLSTFELTILGSYDPDLLNGGSNSFLAALIFVLAVTCVLVVALNALISVLADSYARVQEHATANRRKERAELIVEYMTLLPRWKIRQIEQETRYFHALLEADADGDLVIETDDWRGGLNALRDDIEEMNESNADVTKQALEEMRAEIDAELRSFQKEVYSMLRDISADVKKIQKNQRVDALVVSGRRVAGAVKAVKQIRFQIGRNDDNTRGGGKLKGKSSKRSRNETLRSRQKKNK